ncbi:MAG: SGNH/GDSL hydrolase family protein [Spirochaetia bacterium]
MIKNFPTGFNWVFFGDSITDANRLLSLNPHKALGHGYVQICSDLINNLTPHMLCNCINRGISGNRLHELIQRLDKDVIDESPNLVSILVGINDVLRAVERDQPSPLDQFVTAYRAMIEEIQARTNARIVLLQPFLLMTNEERFLPMLPELAPKQLAIAELAQEYKLPFIRLHDIFAELSKHRPPSYWASDGIHPTHSGHMTIALELTKTLMIPGFF